MSNQKIAVIGYGMWGKNIVRNFYNLNVSFSAYTRTCRQAGAPVRGQKSKHLNIVSQKNRKHKIYPQISDFFCIFFRAFFSLSAQR